MCTCFFFLCWLLPVTDSLGQPPWSPASGIHNFWSPPSACGQDVWLASNQWNTAKVTGYTWLCVYDDLMVVNHLHRRLSSSLRGQIRLNWVHCFRVLQGCKEGISWGFGLIWSLIWERAACKLMRSLAASSSLHTFGLRAWVSCWLLEGGSV